MRAVEYFLWYLPPEPHRGPRAKPRLSTYKMSAEDAAKRGAIRPEPTSREVRMIPETREEIEQAMANSPGVAIMRAKEKPG
jgi:hypothetical protein